MDSVSAANGTFAFDLFKKLSENDSKCNMFFSPLSISSALAMVSLGAKSTTAAQMSKVLHLKSADVHVGFQLLLSEINMPGKDYVLRIANRLYGEKSFAFIDEFLGSALKYYDADLKSVDFAENSDECRKEINEWVEQKTEGKIQNILPDGTVHSDTRLVLVNAVYFKGIWADQFDKTYTREIPFYLNKNETKPVQMMFKKAEIKMAHVGSVMTKVLELPYVNNELSMIIFLPDYIKDGSTGLEKLEKELNYEKFLEWTNEETLHLSEIDLFIPKFKLEDKFNLKSVLSSLGMSDAFDIRKSDFSGISPNKDLVLSKVMHKSFVDVNEEGTEAAAATAVVMSCDSLGPQIICDHPFLFFITHKQSHSILFCGRFTSP
ncbi:serpin B8-like isoform 2-T2 [Discoglossus pictus]